MEKRNVIEKARKAYLKGATWLVLAVMSLGEAKAQMADPLSKIKDGMGMVIGLIMILAFPVGLYLIFSGVKAKKDGDGGWSNSVVAGGFLVAAPLIVGSLYYIFGFQDATSDVNFSFSGGSGTP